MISNAMIPVVRTRRMLQHFADSIWIADGPPVRFMGALLPTRMIVVKLSDGSLWINSPTMAPRATIDLIAAMGPVRYLIAPTAFHTWRLEAGHRAFPDAALWSAPTVTREQLRIPVAGRLGDRPPADWANDLDQLIFKGSFAIKEVEFLHKPSGTVVLADLIQNYPAKPGDVFGNALRGLGGVLNGGVPLDIKLSFATNRTLARQSLERLLSWDFDKLIIAHGQCIEYGARAFVEKAFRWLKPR